MCPLAQSHDRRHSPADGSCIVERADPARHDLPAISLHRRSIISFFAVQTTRQWNQRKTDSVQGHPPGNDAHCFGNDLQWTIPLRLRIAARGERVGPDRTGVDVRLPALHVLQSAHTSCFRGRRADRLFAADVPRRRTRRTRRHRSAFGSREYRRMGRPPMASRDIRLWVVRSRGIAKHASGHRLGIVWHVHGRISAPETVVAQPTPPTT